MSKNFEGHHMNNPSQPSQENSPHAMPSLPDDFRQNVLGVRGEEGEEWLRQLPNLLNEYSQKWSLSIGTPEHKLNFNYVVPADLADGTEAILKVGWPNPELLSEIDTLKAYDGKKAVKLLKADREGGVLLLERVRPGQALTEIQEHDDEEAIKIAAAVIRDLPVAVPSEGNFPTVVEWAEAFKRLRSEELPSEVVNMLDRAEELLAELEQSKKEEKLLHGDLHFENILLDKKNGWIAIDPKGVIGDPVYETARLLHNGSNLLKNDNPQLIIEQRIERLSEMLGYDKERIAKWAYVDSMLTGCWSMEDNSDYKSAIEFAKIFQRIIEKK